MEYPEEVVNDELIIRQISGYSVKWIPGALSDPGDGSTEITITLLVEDDGEWFLTPALEALRQGTRRLALRIAPGVGKQVDLYPKDKESENV